MQGFGYRFQKNLGGGWDFWLPWLPKNTGWLPVKTFKQILKYELKTSKIILKLNLKDEIRPNSNAPKFFVR